MSAAPVVIRTEQFTIEGSSRAGNETWFRVRELGVALDIGRCPDVLVGVPHIFVTHAHLDHALGIPFYAAQRNLQRLSTGSVYLPAETIEDMEAMMRLHEKLEGTHYDLQLIGLRPGEERRVRRNLQVRAHRSSHRVPTNAWEFLEVRHHVRPEFAAMTAEDFVRLRREGTSFEEEVQHSMLFYTGDTDRKILEENDAMFLSDVLMIECSFIAPGHADRAERYRHIHLDDIFEFADRYRNATVILTHFSLRYSPEEIQALVSKRCPAVLLERLRLALPAPFDRLS